MKILETEFDSRGFHFKQLKRDGMLAVFEKTSENGYKGFETVRIKSHNGYSIAGVDIAPAESMPNAESWGLDGFSYMFDEKERAFTKLEWMRDFQFKSVSQTANSKDIKPKKEISCPTGAFTIGELATFNDISYITAHNFIKENKHNSIVFVREERRQSRGKMSKIFKEISLK